jgi:galactokinase
VPCEDAAVTDRLDAANHLARDTFGAAPAWRFFVPGRIEVLGKHTDYAGGRSLVCAVPRGFGVATFPSDDRDVLVVHAGAGERLRCALDDLPPRETGWRAYALAVVRRLSRNFPGARLGARIVFDSDLPHAAGISSSSALVVALAEALIARAGLEETTAWQTAIRSDEDRAGYFGCIENGAPFGPLTGDAGVGTHGGSEDHAAIVMSRAGELRMFSYDPIRLESVVAMPPRWTFVVAFSGVHAAKGEGRQADYNHLALACRAIVDAWREHHPSDRRTLGQLVRDGALPHAPVAQGFSPALAWRLEHFAAEDARVAEAAAAFARGNIRRIGELAAQSHDAAARLLGNQVPETHALVNLAREAGAVAASAFGGGWGGSVWALVPDAEAHAFLEHWLGAYRTQHPHPPATGFVSPPSEGIVRG